MVSARRSPRSAPSLARFDATELGRIAVSHLLAKTAIDPEMIDHTIIGCVSQPAMPSNIARVIALRAGIPRRVPAITVNRNCASGSGGAHQCPRETLRRPW